MEKPPAHDIMQPPSAAQTFGFVSSIFVIGVHCLAAPVSLMTSKFGTVGLKAYWMSSLLACLMLLALSTCLIPQDRLMFQATLPLMGLFYWAHIIATLSSKRHVLLHSVGETSGWLHFGLGGLVLFTCAMFHAYNYLWFYCASMGAAFVRDRMIDARDKVRAAYLADAMAEQDYAMRQYETYRRGKS